MKNHRAMRLLCLLAMLLCPALSAAGEGARTFTLPAGESVALYQPDGSLLCAVSDDGEGLEQRLVGVKLLGPDLTERWMCALPGLITGTHFLSRDNGQAFALLGRTALEEPYQLFVIDPASCTATQTALPDGARPLALPGSGGCLYAVTDPSGRDILHVMSDQGSIRMLGSFNGRIAGVNSTYAQLYATLFLQAPYRDLEGRPGLAVLGVNLSDGTLWTHMLSAAEDSFIQAIAPNSPDSAAVAWQKSGQLFITCLDTSGSVQWEVHVESALSFPTVQTMRVETDGLLHLYGVAGDSIFELTLDHLGQEIAEQSAECDTMFCLPYAGNEIYAIDFSRDGQQKEYRITPIADTGLSPSSIFAVNASAQ